VNFTSHLILSAGLGAVVWRATDSPTAAVTTAACGVFTDVDHVIEFWNWFVKERKDSFYVVFHAWEYFAILALVFAFGPKSPLLLGAIVGYGSHMITDAAFNNFHPLGYFITYRMTHRFSLRRVKPYGFAPSLERVNQAIPLGRFYMPLLVRICRNVAGRLKLL
jgi:hypothetical protein